MARKSRLRVFGRAAAWLVAAAALSGQAPPPPAWDPAPWLEDLAAMRTALDTKYANHGWLREEREIDLSALWPRLEERVRQAGSDAAARAVFDRMIQRIGDGHVSLRWPAARGGPAAAAGHSTPEAPAANAAAFCRRIGYDAGQSRRGTAAALPGYRALPGESVFPAGTVPVGKTKLGVVRIGIFQPQGSPALCEGAVAALGLPLDEPCDSECDNRIITWAYERMTRDFEARLAALRAAGADALLVDISDNGGGSEWAEAAARMVTPFRLRSAETGFVHGAHWTRLWGDLAGRLRAFASDFPKDRAQLEDFARRAEAAKREAESPCPGAAPCLGRAGFATGLVGEAASGAFAGKAWAPHVFSISQFPYRDGVWAAPLLVLVDQETWSAAEQFAAVLQDNRAAVIVGARTGGAGCGHSWGGTPSVLPRSGAVLELPDCVRYRRDGSNEVRGVIPDVLVGLRASDGAALKGRLVAAKLADAVAAARRLSPDRRIRSASRVDKRP